LAIQGSNIFVGDVRVTGWDFLGFSLGSADPGCQDNEDAVAPGPVNSEPRLSPPVVTPPKSQG